MWTHIIGWLLFKLRQLTKSERLWVSSRYCTEGDAINEFAHHRDDSGSNFDKHRTG
jgi:hypothetical protein